MFTKHTEETKRQISESLKKLYAEHPEKKTTGPKQSQAIGRVTKGKFNSDPKSFYDLSSRTASKVLKRMNLGCSRCGWHEGSCDLHHIHGRKIENPHDHSNLSLLCPNCHRLANEKKIKPEELTNLRTQIGDSWRSFYFG